MNTNELMTMVNQMTPEEILNLSNALINSRISKVEEGYRKIEERQTEQKHLMDKLFTSVRNIQNNQNELNIAIKNEAQKNIEQDELLDIISLGKNSYMWKKLKKICWMRIHNIFYGYENTPEYLIFMPFLIRNIYVSTANAFNVSSTGNISKTDFESACVYAENYFPTKEYLQTKFNELYEKAKINTIKPNRIAALFSYISDTSKENLLFGKFTYTGNKY